MNLFEYTTLEVGNSDFTQLGDYCWGGDKTAILVAYGVGERKMGSLWGLKYWVFYRSEILSCTELNARQKASRN